jgi:hypothetical protein
VPYTVLAKGKGFSFIMAIDMTLSEFSSFLIESIATASDGKTAEAYRWR